MAGPQTKPPRGGTTLRPPQCLNSVQCISIAFVFLGFLVLVGFALLITHLILKPKQLDYSIEAASIQDFTISNKGDHIDAKFNYVIISNNTDKHVSVRYLSMRISTFHHNQPVAETKIASFKQRSKNETKIVRQLVSEDVALSKFNAKYLRAEKAKGMIEMEVHVTARVRYTTWIFPSRKRTLKVVCSPVMLNVTASSLDGFKRVICKTRL